MDFPKSSGIYLIRNIQNGKCYVGQSENVKRRVEAHERALRHNLHYNVHLQSAWNMYGSSSFEFVLLELCTEAKLDEREIYYIEIYNAFSNGYNMNIGGNANRGYRHTDESKRKMRESHRDVSGENNPMFGRAIQEFMTDEEIISWRQHLSEATRGEKNPFYGKTHCKETREKLSNALKGRFVGEKSPNYGKQLTPERCERMSSSRKYYLELHPELRYVSATKVFCLSTNELFDSMSDAARKYGIMSSNISTCCAGGVHYVGTNEAGTRLVWVYYEDYLNMTDDEIAEKLHRARNTRKGKYSGKSKPVTCLNTGEVFESARIAAEYYSVDNSSLCKVCRGQKSSCGVDSLGNPLKWAFYETNKDSNSNCA